MAVLPSSLNFSRYIFLFPSALARQPAASGGINQWSGRLSLVDRLAAVVETMDSRGIRGQRHQIARLHAELANVTCGQRAERPGLDIKERVAAKMLSDHDLALPTVPIVLDRQMLRPHPDGRSVVLFGSFARNEVHLG